MDKFERDTWMPESGVMVPTVTNCPEYAFVPFAVYDQLRQQLAATIAERDRALKDAERYREARLHVKAADVRNRIGRCDETRHADYLATVDATIDAAIAAIAAGGEGDRHG